mmetsp:Transcript_50009/g.113618  ORF Transcript_50009/g.113618 Transcript_50009/m.113618 type:complete len:235 (-) Transcript_50009:3285-3989(-)
MIAQLGEVCRLVTNNAHHAPGLASDYRSVRGQAHPPGARGNKSSPGLWTLGFRCPSVVARRKTDKKIANVGVPFGHLRPSGGSHARSRLASRESEDHKVRSSRGVDVDTHRSSGSSTLGVHGFDADHISVPVVVVGRHRVLLCGLRRTFRALCAQLGDGGVAGNQRHHHKLDGVRDAGQLDNGGHWRISEHVQVGGQLLTDEVGFGTSDSRHSLGSERERVAGVGSPTPCPGKQ